MIKYYNELFYVILKFDCLQIPTMNNEIIAIDIIKRHIYGFPIGHIIVNRYY